MAKLYVVKSSKMIIGLNIMGPLSTPTAMEYKDVLEMVSRGYDIYEVNPKDSREQIKLSKSNVNTVKFKNSRATGVLQRKLNKEFQEMEKPVVVGVVKNDDTQVVITKHHDKVKKEEAKKNNNEDSEVKVSTPDNFVK